MEVTFMFHWGGYEPNQERDDIFWYADPCWVRK